MSSSFRFKALLILGIFVLVLGFHLGKEDRKMKNGVYPKELLTVTEITETGHDSNYRSGSTYWEDAVLTNSKGKVYHKRIHNKVEEYLPSVGNQDIYYIIDGEPEQPAGSLIVWFMIGFGGLLVAGAIVEMSKDR